MNDNASGESCQLHAQHVAMTAAYKRYLRAIGKRPSPHTPSDDPKVEREVWRSIEHALRTHLHYQSSSPPTVLPHEIAFELADAISVLLAGSEPASWRTIRSGRRGPPSMPMEVKSAIATAAAYYLAAQAGVVPDPNPRNTISDEFGVAPSTVDQWLARDLTQIRTDHFSQRSSTRPATMTDAEFALVMLKFSGRNFRESPHVRSHSAVRQRAKRLRKKTI